MKPANDSEVIARLIATPAGQPRWTRLLPTPCGRLRGAYSVVILTEDTLVVGIRDPYGVRPLCLGMLDDKWPVLASETCALGDRRGRVCARNPEPGEMVD